MEAIQERALRTTPRKGAVMITAPTMNRDSICIRMNGIGMSYCLLMEAPVTSCREAA